MRNIVAYQMLRWCWCIAAVTVFAVGAARAQTTGITINGVQPTALQLSIDDLKKLPTRKVRVTNEKKQEAEYEGVPLNAVLTQAGMQLGTAIRGKRLSEYLLVSARDGYSAVFALPELDPLFTDRVVLLCFARDGVALSPEEGPLRLVIPAEKRPARWVRQVSSITLKRD